LILNLRNVGTAGVTMASEYVNGTVRSPGATCPTLAAQATCVMTLTINPAATTGVSYVIKVITIDGAVFSYSAIAGQAS